MKGEVGGEGEEIYTVMSLRSIQKVQVLIATYNRCDSKIYTWSTDNQVHSISTFCYNSDIMELVIDG